MSKEYLEKAKMLLAQTGSTCVLCGSDVILTDKRRGVRPLLDLLEGSADTTDFSAADKVVGKAAAHLYCLLKIKFLYANVISEPALHILKQADIYVEYGQLVPAIKNRTGDGFCPMESAVWNVENSEDALTVIRQTFANLTK